jgi:mannan endo-1,4-beta-mannosidase
LVSRQRRFRAKSKPSESLCLAGRKQAGILPSPCPSDFASQAASATARLLQFDSEPVMVRMAAAVVATALGASALSRPPSASHLPHTQHTWAGINSYYLWSCNDTVRAEALDATRAAGLRVVRVFLLSTQGRGAVAACADSPVPDLEPTLPGAFDDTILGRLDTLMHEAVQRGLKLTVALHDRWSLGCWRSDAYARKYNLTDVYPHCGTEASANDPSRFYVSEEARADFGRRVTHALSYVSKHTGASLGQWSEALFSVEAQNEAFGAPVLCSRGRRG